MSHTHFLYHIVFGTKDRTPIISPAWEGELFSYMSGIIKNLKGHTLVINGVEDHVHLLIRLGPTIKFSDFMRELKAGSSRWVSENHMRKFSWQRRYGAFSVSESVTETVRKYIQCQKQHHAAQSFEEEYTALLERHNIEFDEKYLWD